MVEQIREAIYSRSGRSFPTYWLWINVGLAVIAVGLYKTNALPVPLSVVLVINLLLLVAVLGGHDLKAIHIIEETGDVIITLDRFLFFYKTIQCTVRDISLVFSQQPSAREQEVQVFRIFIKGELLIEAVPGLNGWKASVLQEAKDSVEALQARLHNG